MTSTGTLHRLAACIPGGAAPMSSFGRSTSSLSDRFHSTPRPVRLHHAALNASGFEGCQRQPLRDLGPLPPPHHHPPSCCHSNNAGIHCGDGGTESRGRILNDGG
ncbi:unnamed protein product [Urochloa humidicola]